MCVLKFIVKVYFPFYYIHATILFFRHTVHLRVLFFAWHLLENCNILNAVGYRCKFWKAISKKLPSLVGTLNAAHITLLFPHTAPTNSFFCASIVSPSPRIYSMFHFYPAVRHDLYYFMSPIPKIHDMEISRSQEQCDHVSLTRGWGRRARRAFVRLPR